MKKLVNQQTFTEKISKKTGLNKIQSDFVLRTILSEIQQDVKNGNEVRFTGFGSFESRNRHARGGVNPQNPNERIKIPAVKVMKFKTGKTTKDILKGLR